MPDNTMENTAAIAALHAAEYATQYAAQTTLKTALSSLWWMLGTILAAGSCVGIAALKLSYHGSLFVARSASGTIYARFCPTHTPPMIEDHKFNGNLNGWDEINEMDKELQDLKPRQ